MEEAGFIRGYHADVNSEALGFGVTVFAQVGLSSQAETDLRKFEDLVATWPLVRECHMLAGETDFLLKVVAEDWDASQKFLPTQLTAAPSVSHGRQRGFGVSRDTGVYCRTASNSMISRTSSPTQPLSTA